MVLALLRFQEYLYCSTVACYGVIINIYWNLFTEFLWLCFSQHELSIAILLVMLILMLSADHYDVKMPCHLILSKLADKCPSAVLAVLDSIVEPIEKTISHKPKGDAVKQEVDRNEDMIRSTLRAISSLSRISGSDYSMRFKNLMNKIVSTPALAEKYNSVRSE